MTRFLHKSRAVVLSTYEDVWALLDVGVEVNMCHNLLQSLRRKLSGQALSGDDLDILANVFRFSMLGERGTSWHAGIRTLAVGENNLRGRAATLTIVVPLTQNILHYGADKNRPDFTEITYGEAFFIEQRNKQHTTQPLVTSDQGAECLFIAFDTLGLKEALAFL